MSRTYKTGLEQVLHFYKVTKCEIIKESKIS